jgi:hypothetical protein
MPIPQDQALLEMCEPKLDANEATEEGQYEVRVS